MTTDHFRLPAGWYADPETAGERWWNGSQWTSHTRAAAGSQQSGLEGQPPAAWSATDQPLATVLDDGPARTGTAAFEAPQPYAGPVPLAIAPGWYPDPQGLPAQRWWDGARWTDHSAPTPNPAVSYPVGYRPGGPAVHVPYGGTTVVMMQPRKSVGVALVLTFFFGPLGMFYSTVSGALIMLAVLVFGGMFVGVVTLGLAWLVWWPFVWVVSMIWGCLAAGQQPTGPVVNHYR